MLEALAAAAKALLYLGVLYGAGAVFADASLRAAAGSAAASSAQRMRRGAQLTIAAALIAALLLVFRLGGEFDVPTLSAVFLSSYGAALCFQVAGSALVLVAIGEDATDRGMRWFDAALVTASFALCGHAADAGAFGTAVAWLHVSAAAWWVGSLCLLRHACGHLELPAIAALLRRFSGRALKVVAALVAAGGVLVITLLGFTRRPLASAYGQLLFLKIALALAVVGLAGYNRLQLTPRLLAGDQTAVGALRRTIDAELLIIGAVLITTAILTTYTSPPEGIP